MTNGRRSIKAHCQRIKGRLRRWKVIGGRQGDDLKLVLDLIDRELAFQRDELQELESSYRKKLVRVKIMRLTRLRGWLSGKEG